MFTIHNIKFQGVFPKYYLWDVLGLSGNQAAMDQLAFFDSINYMKGALCYSDYLTTVSPNYAEEIHTAYFGEKMEYIFSRRHEVLFGILNGIDVVEYNPKTDKNIPANYDHKDLSKKAANKRELQRRLGLSEEPDTPLIVMISRLTEQKGIDLLLRILEELLEYQKVQVAILGTGEACYENAMQDIMSRHHGQMECVLDFSPSLSHLFYAGGDLLVMPSRFEPCGLSQMIAMRYGTLPVVRETGGLKDSVIPYNEYTREGNGFSFANYNAHELFAVLRYAISIYQESKDTWNQIINQAMLTDFSWSESALQYIELYKKLVNR
jgi:starch synthase